MKLEASRLSDLTLAAVPETAGAPPAPGPKSTEFRPDPHLVSLSAPASFEAEQYRALVHEIERRGGGGLRLVAVTSPGAGEGKTTTAVNLAGGLAQAPGCRVLLMDLDVRVPSMERLLGLPDEEAPGLTDAVLDPGRPLGELVRSLPPHDLSVLPAGRKTDQPFQLFRSPGLRAVLEEARRRYDFVVMDTPPLAPVPDSRFLAEWVDGFLLVVAAHRTRRELLAEALDLMEPEKVIGLVFNGDDFTHARYYGAYYGYGAERGRGRRGRKR